jgi:hypothetical protein
MLVGSIVPTLLAAFCPTMLAHGALITSDGWFSFFLALAPVSIAAMLDAAADAPPRGPAAELRACIARGGMAGAAVGGVLVAKHSGVIIAPVAAALLALRLAAPPRAPAGRYAARLCAGVGVAVLAAYAALWAVYRFRYGAFAHGECLQWRRNWDAVRSLPAPPSPSPAPSQPTRTRFLTLPPPRSPAAPRRRRPGPSLRARRRRRRRRRAWGGRGWAASTGG